MNTFDYILFFIQRALEVSVELMSPLLVILYFLMIAGLYVLHLYKGDRFGSFITILASVFFFFVIWNHPAFSWYKKRPFDGGYVYSWIMVAVYVYLPITVLVMGTHAYKKIKDRKTRR